MKTMSVRPVIPQSMCFSALLNAMLFLKACCCVELQVDCNLMTSLFVAYEIEISILLGGILLEAIPGNGCMLQDCAMCKSALVDI